MPRVEAFDRDQVLLKATGVFWEKGYNGTSMQDLVDVTGLNRSSLYNSFGSKKELYRAVLSAYARENQHNFQQILLASGGALEAIRKIFELSLKSVAADKEGKGCMILNCKGEMGNQDAAIRKWLDNNQEHTVDLFEQLLLKGQRDGEISFNRPSREVAYYLYSSFQGFRMTGILMQDNRTLRAVIDQIMNNIQ